MKNNKLTVKQKKVLEIIYRSIESDGYAPTLEDLREDMEVSSNQSVLNFLASFFLFLFAALIRCFIEKEFQFFDLINLFTVSPG